MLRPRLSVALGLALLLSAAVVLLGRDEPAGAPTGVWLLMGLSGAGQAILGAVALRRRGN